MKRSIIVLLTAVVLILAMVTPIAAVTNGTPDGDDHPYVGLLVFDIEIDGQNVPAWRCSGSLISEDVVLTAGHCTDGAVAARIWFDERLQDDDGTFLVPDYPFGGVVAVEGTPHTNPDFAIGAGNGLPGFALRDVGVVVLDEPVDDVGAFADLPEPGVVDELRNKADLDLVGYGVQEQFHIPGGGAPFWTGLRNRLYAPADFVSGNFKHAPEFVKVTANPGGGTGGTCFGDSGGPVLLGGTDTALAVNSYVTNGNCAGVTYSSRVDIPEVLEWIYSFM